MGVVWLTAGVNMVSRLSQRYGNLRDSTTGRGREGDLGRCDEHDGRPEAFETPFYIRSRVGYSSMANVAAFSVGFEKDCWATLDSW